MLGRKGGRRKKEHEGLRVRESIPEEVTVEHRLVGDDPAVGERGPGGVHAGTKPCVLKEGQDARVDGDTALAPVAPVICASWGPCFCATPHP